MSDSAKYAPVASLGILRRLLVARALGDYLLLLCPEVTKDLPSWSRFVKEVKEVEPNAKIILDNGAYEGMPTPIGMLTTVAEQIGANIVVLPDQMKEPEFTVRVLEKAHEHIYQRALHFEMDFMWVIQSCSASKIEALVELWKRVSGEIKYLALPKWMGSSARLGALRLIGNQVDRQDRFIHLLGFADSLETDLLSCFHRSVMGIDSSEPIRAGLREVPLGMFADGKFPPREPDYLRLEPGTLLPVPRQVYSNIYNFRKILSDKEFPHELRPMAYSQDH